MTNPPGGPICAAPNTTPFRPKRVCSTPGRNADHRCCGCATWAPATPASPPSGSSVFTQRQTAYYQSVLCLDADSGEPVWEYRYGWPYEAAGMYPGPRATPTWHDGRVYFAAPDGLVGCLDARDGRLLWSRNVTTEFDGKGTEFGYSASPTVEAGKVILPVGGAGASVVALDARDGSTVWASGDHPASYCSALPITFRGRRLVVAFLQNDLALLDLATGRWLWQQRVSTGYDEHAAMPLYEEPYLLLAYPFRAGADLYELQAAAPQIATEPGGRADRGRRGDGTPDPAFPAVVQRRGIERLDRRHGLWFRFTRHAIQGPPSIAGRIPLSRSGDRKSPLVHRPNRPRQRHSCRRQVDPVQ